MPTEIGGPGHYTPPPRRRGHPGRGKPRKRPPDRDRDGKHAKPDRDDSNPDSQMVTSSVTTAPASAGQDVAADQSDGDLAAFFSTGSGPVMHYDRPAVSGEIASQTQTEVVSP